MDLIEVVFDRLAVAETTAYQHLYDTVVSEYGNQLGTANKSGSAVKVTHKGNGLSLKTVKSLYI